jgi:signal peptidase II
MSHLNRAAQLLVLFLLLATSVGCDQAAKIFAEAQLSHSEPISVLNGVVRFEYAENSGAFLSLGSALPASARFFLLVVVVAGLLALGIGFTIFSDRINLRQKAVLALAVGGGLGNLIDRISHGAVVDFMSLGIGPLRTGIFNFADVAITVGMVGVLWLAGTEPRDAHRGAIPFGGSSSAE